MGQLGEPKREIVVVPAQEPSFPPAPAPSEPAKAPVKEPAAPKEPIPA